ncbi:hypothetical protein QJS10_CPB12g01009 [Acorus calamus]|uniref:Uncharacterized protein n=1 Tax=Acorus calamus TaxID=4465 RepID=A0AAV9DJF7_ACOCL|nr:hypothetical protein QJS10_CPB12g01009 [Acorus calamus]
MDPKATARSKRSHSLHHQRKPPHSAAAKKHPPQPSTRESRPLPSNWDRYADGEAVEGEQAGPVVSGGPDGKAAAVDGSVVRKSKGADFGYLLSQARENPNQLFPSIDDAFPEFYKGMSTLVSARGDSLLCWSGDDNFLVDSSTPSGFEIPYLSLDLNALEARLANVDLHERLFVEMDVLSAELLEKTNAQAPESSSSAPSPDDHEILSKDGEDSHETPQAAEFQTSSSPAKAESNLGLHSSVDQTIVRGIGELLAELEVSTTSSSKDWRITSTFEASAAESQLDMLLDSFDPGLENPGPVKHAIDSSIDDLLAETATMENWKKSSTEEATDRISGSSDPVSKPTEMDFDSWLDTL